MAVYTEESVRANIRVRDGKRVFYQADGDHLTPSAREWLHQERIEILPAAEAKPKVYRTLTGAVLTEKPEHMTHLRADVLVPKDHPRIALRGKIDELEAELLLAGALAVRHGRKETAKQLEEILEFVRLFIRCDVLEEPLQMKKLCGLTMDQLREQSHLPQKYFDLPHFMPDFRDSDLLLTLNKVRTKVRETELAVYEAFRDRDGNVLRSDLQQGMNRLSSLLWILMIQMRKEERHGTGT